MNEDYLESFGPSRDASVKGPAVAAADARYQDLQHLPLFEGFRIRYNPEEGCRGSDRSGLARGRLAAVGRDHTMPMMERLAGLVCVTAFSGCYTASEGEPGGEESGLSESGDGSSAGSSSGPVPAGRGIVEDNGFKIYWEHYEVWDQGACTRIRLKNEGRQVRGWSMTVDLSEDIVSWLDAGGAFMWLVDDQIFIEQEDYTDFAPWESVEMYYCAEPAVLIDDVSVTFQEESTDDGDGDASDASTFEGEVPWITETGHSVVWSYTAYHVADYTCMDVALENRSDVALEFISFTAQMSNTTSYVDVQGGAPIDETSSLLTFLFDIGAVAEPASQVAGRVCMTPVARPVELLDVVARPAM